MLEASMISILSGNVIPALLSNLASGATGVRAKFEESPEGARARRNRLLCRAAAGAVLTLGGIAVTFGWLVFDWARPWITASIIATLVLSVAVALLGTVTYRSALSAFIPRATLDVEEESRKQEAQQVSDTTVPALLQFNRERMVIYHGIATGQARSAGRNSQFAMILGFLALVTGAAIAIGSNDTATKVVTGSLAALGGIFSGYIARTFLVAQDKAIWQLYKYWEQPLTTSYLLAAERIALTFDGGQAQNKQLEKIIDQLLLIAKQRDSALGKFEAGRTPFPNTSSGRRGVDNTNSSSENVDDPKEYTTP